MNNYKKYLFYISAIIFSGLSSLFLINSTVDTLWYFGGNKFFPENYSFNERLSKVNLYLKSPAKFNCIILGSSRVTLLDAEKIENDDCFNFSFSDGMPSEFVYYSHYIKKYGRLPEKLIIGVDARFYSRKEIPPNVPRFVKTLDLPPSFFKSYLSYDVLDFTIRTLQKKPPRQRYYTQELKGDLLPGTKNYQPPECFTPYGFGDPYTDKNIHYISSIKNILKARVVIGYIAPVSAWDMLPLMEDGELESYMTTMYALSKEFDRFYDFSIPSELTMRTDNNYDGHHFSKMANNEIANVLNEKKSTVGLALHTLSYEEYRNIFISAMRKFLNNIGTRKRSHWGCPHRSAVR